MLPSYRSGKDHYIIRIQFIIGSYHTLTLRTTKYVKFAYIVCYLRQ